MSRVRLVLSSLLGLQHTQLFRNLRMQRQDSGNLTNTATLMWQCACTISSVQTVLQRANCNSLMYYTITHIESTSSSPTKESQKFSTSTLRKKSILLDETQTIDEIKSLDELRPMDELGPEDDIEFEVESPTLQMEDFYPSYPAFFY